MNRSDQLSAAETNGGAGTLAVGTSYRIGDWEFDLGAQTLVREGEARPLMPKVARLLEHLAATAPDPLTRDQLIDLLWPGADVSDHALHELVSQLRKQLGDDARAPRYLATLSRRGYRLIAPVTTPGRESAPRGSVPSDRTIAIGAINTTGTTGPLSHDPAPPTPAAASVADLLTDRFVRFPELRLTPAAGDNRPASAAYELLGQLDRSDGGLHGHFQLVRTSDQHRVWTETFSTADDGPAGLADLATQVARRARLRLVCDRQCQLLRARAISIEAADLTCSAVAMNYRINQQGMFDPELMRAQAARAVQLDPGLLEAWQMLPTAYLWLGHSPGLTISEAAARSHEALDEALRLNPDDAYTYWLLGTTKVVLEADADAGEAALLRALDIDPLHPNAHWFHSMLGFVYRHRGELTRALNAHRRAVRIFDSDGRTQAELAEVLHYAGDHEQAIAVAETALSLNPFPQSTLIASLIGFRAHIALGRRDAASAWLQRYLGTMEPAHHHHAAYMMAVLGQKSAARDLLGRFEDGTSMQGYTLVLAHLGLGDLLAAVAAARHHTGPEGNSLVCRMKIDPALAPVQELRTR